MCNYSLCLWCSSWETNICFQLPRQIQTCSLKFLWETSSFWHQIPEQTANLRFGFCSNKASGIENWVFSCQVEVRRNLCCQTAVICVHSLSNKNCQFSRTGKISFFSDCSFPKLIFCFSPKLTQKAAKRKETAQTCIRLFFTACKNISLQLCISFQKRREKHWIQRGNAERNVKFSPPIESNASENIPPWHAGAVNLVSWELFHTILYTSWRRKNITEWDRGFSSILVVEGHATETKKTDAGNPKGKSSYNPKTIGPKSQVWTFPGKFLSQNAESQSPLYSQPSPHGSKQCVQVSSKQCPRVFLGLDTNGSLVLLKGYFGFVMDDAHSDCFWI